MESFVEVRVVEGNVTELDTPLLVVNVFRDVSQPVGATQAVDRALGGLITGLIADGEIAGKADSVTLIHTNGRIRAKRVAVVGLGRQEDFGLDRVRRAMAIVAKDAVQRKITKLATIPHGAGMGGIAAEQCAQAIVEGAGIGSYEYRRLKTDAGEIHPPLDLLQIVEVDRGKIEPLRAGARVGDVVSRGTMFAQDLSNGPANIVTPAYLADEARAVAERYGLGCEILGRAELEQRRFGTLLAVAAGSDREPRLIVLRYNGRPGGKTLAVVGKGITFDTGGISIKPADGMWYMKHDMSGAAAAIALAQVVAELKMAVNLVVIAAATENMPGGNATRPGDVVTSYSGKSIEIQNTDAEGRLVLADALALAAEQRPDAIVDLATLTGACVIALGHHASGAFTNNEGLLATLSAIAPATGERIWPLPLWEEYGEELKSDVADLKNIGAGRYGGAIHGASFLSNFVGAVPWIHLDIAGTAWAEKELPYAAKGATGVGVRLLHALANSWQ